MATLLIDDQRNLPADRVARTYKERIEALRERHWDPVYLDDLGDFSGVGGRELTGYDIACWLEQNPQFLPDRIEIVTSNPAGRWKIEMALQRSNRVNQQSLFDPCAIHRFDERVAGISGMCRFRHILRSYGRRLSQYPWEDRHKSEYRSRSLKETERVPWLESTICWEARPVYRLSGMR